MNVQENFTSTSSNFIYRDLQWLHLGFRPKNMRRNGRLQSFLSDAASKASIDYELVSLVVCVTNIKPDHCHFLSRETQSH